MDEEVIDPTRETPDLEETVCFRALKTQMKQVNEILKAERAIAQINGEEETLYTDKSKFIRAAISREIRRYRELRRKENAQT